MNEKVSGQSANAGMKFACGLLALCNGVVVLIFMVLALVAPAFSELSTRVQFTELDRAGVINADKLDPKDPRWAFSKDSLGFRSTVPIHIARAPLAGQRFNAELGLVVALVNTAAFGVIWWLMGRGKRGKDSAELTVEPMEKGVAGGGGV